MADIKLFYLDGCPYCANARKALAELMQENEAFRAVGIEWIEETAHPDIADEYDYYRVPTLFCGDTKLYEADPSHGYQEIRDGLKNALLSVLNGSGGAE